MGHLGDDTWADRLAPLACTSRMSLARHDTFKRSDMAEKLFSQGELEAIAAALGDTADGLTGSEIGHLLVTITMVDLNPTATKWVRLHNAFVERQNRAQNRRAILEFIRQAMLPARLVKRPERFEPMRANLNRALAFSGIAVDAGGELIAADQVKTLPEAARRADELRADLVGRGVHADVLRFCSVSAGADPRSDAGNVDFLV